MQGLWCQVDSKDDKPTCSSHEMEECVYIMLSWCHRYLPGTATMLNFATPAANSKRGPKTPEGKARSAMNARRHGLRARTFGILPEEDQAEWALHVEELRAGYGPADDTEFKLVEAIAAAMWNEIRADRTLAEVMATIPPLAPGRPHGSDLQEPRHALSLNTAIRYMTAASMATQRAQRAFLAHRKARWEGLILPEMTAPPNAAK